MTTRLDATIHPVNHLRLCAVLAAVPEAEFSTLRDLLGVNGPSLSKYLKALQDAGYVTLSRSSPSDRRRTWAHLTDTGRHAFTAHLTELQHLAAGAQPDVAHAADDLG